MSQRYPDAPESRRGMPVWGWVLVGCGALCVLAIPVIAIMAAIFFPVFSQARERARQMSCLSNVKQMGVAMMMYAQDYDEQLPRSANWMDRIYPYTKNEGVYHCPSLGPPGPGSFGYAFNSGLSGKKLEKIPSPATTRMLYDSTNLARNASDAVTSLAPRHNGGYNMGYADGHAKWLRGAGTALPGGGP